MRRLLVVWLLLTTHFIEAARRKRFLRVFYMLCHAKMSEMEEPAKFF